MKKLHLYMIKSNIGPFVLTFFITIFILLMQFLWKYVDDLVGKGLEWDVILRLMFYASATFVPLALPLAVLLSSLMTFGNLGENYELVAIKSVGISLQKAMRPLTILAFLISIGAFLFANYVYPVANLKFGSLLYDVRQKKLAFNLDEGVFDNNLNGYVIRAGSKSKDNNTIYNIMIYDHTKNQGDNQVTVAKKANIELTPNQKKAIFTLYDGYTYHDITNERGYQQKRPFEYMKFGKEILSIDLSQLALQRTNEDLFKSNYTMLNVRQLNHAIDSLSEQLVRREKDFRKNSIRKYGYLAIMDTGRVNRTIPKQTEKDAKIQSLYPLLKQYDNTQQNVLIDQARNKVKVDKDNYLFHTTKYIEPREKLIIQHEIVWHQKFKLSLACLIFFFIGAPLGAIIRKGGLGLPVVISVIFFVIYHVVSVIGEKSARTEDMNIILGMWLSTMVILPLGLFLTYKATTDAPLMDTESWKKFFETNWFFRKTLKIIEWVKQKFFN
ncbi:MAG: LptF/LptG family permease [Bacteroidales bacterium]|nr:LptF/LptG family permease [Bacteroidales bacterium]